MNSGRGPNETASSLRFSSTEQLCGWHLGTPQPELWEQDRGAQFSATAGTERDEEGSGEQWAEQSHLHSKLKRPKPFRKCFFCGASKTLPSSRRASHGRRLRFAATK